MISMFGMWVSGWCTALAIDALVDGRYAVAAIDFGLALLNGFNAWMNRESK